MLLKKILVLHPDGLLGEDSFYRQSLVCSKLQPYMEVDASEDCDPKVVKEAILSGRFNTILVCDLSDNERWFANEFRSCLRKFVSAGGMIAWPTSEGGHLNDFVLKPVFDVEWKMEEYFRTDFIKTSNNVVANWFPNGPASVNMKACMLKNVSPEERIYFVSEGACSQSFVWGVNPVSDNQLGLASVAVGKFGEGAFAYFGDVNCEKDTVVLVHDFLEAARSKDLTTFAHRLSTQ